MAGDLKEIFTSFLHSVQFNAKEIKKKILICSMNVTYLLGAGASAEALPIVNQLKLQDGREIEGMSTAFVRVANAIRNNSVESENNAYRENKIISLNHLAESAKQFETIDTYAKFLYLKDAEALKVLKDTLIFFSCTSKL